MPRHRATPARPGWKAEVFYLRNRWHFFVKPALRARIKAVRPK